MFTHQKYSELNIPNTTNSLDGCFAYLKELVRVPRGVNQDLKKKIINPARLGITRIQPGEECAVTRGRSCYPLLRGMNSTYKYYGAAFVIFEFPSFDLQTSVADDL